MEENNLMSVYPEIAAEWNYEKNQDTGLNPYTVAPHSDKKVWWICKENHSYFARIDHRTRMKSGCPYCSGNLPIKGVNDLATKHPELLKEWDYGLNELQPEKYLSGSNKVVSWICPICNQSYKRKISERTARGLSCRNCSKESHTSLPEQTILFYFSKVVRTENRKKIHGKEIDIFIPSLNTGIEYNGEYYHQNRNQDNAKYEYLRNSGIKIIVIQCDRSRNISDNVITLKTNEKSNPSNNELSWGITKIFEILELPVPDINIKRDIIDIYGLYIKSIKENSLVSKFPDIAREWNYSLNKDLKPESFSYGSNKCVWWTCPDCNNDYDMIISNRTIGNSGCPYCVGKRIKIGFNDLATTNHELISEWNYEKNEHTPEHYTKGSDKKVWWLCKKGHEWQTSISSRVSDGVGCPVCAGKQALFGYNDLTTANPELLKIWNYNKNNTRPNSYTKGSNKKVWWICDKCGHEWQAQINSVVNGRRCPMCAKASRPIRRNKTLIGQKGSLAQNHPDLLKEWDYEKNKLPPEEYLSGSSKKVWWKCNKCGHEWKAQINSVVKGSRCPMCAKAKCPVEKNKTLIVQKGSLAQNHPDLLKEWDYEKNKLPPEEYLSGSSKKVWWKCRKCEHSWKSTPYQRTSRNQGCPKCAGRVKIKNLDTPPATLEKMLFP